jgi:hypothetical protein
MIINRYLENSAGESNANGEYALAEEDFFVQPAAGRIIQIFRMIVSVADTTGMTAIKYGNGAALTNGVKITVQNSASDILLDLTPIPVTSNAQWAGYCYDADLKSWGSGDELLVVRWTFSKSGEPITLKNRDKFVVTLNDDLDHLIGHRFLVQGKHVAG